MVYKILWSFILFLSNYSHRFMVCVTSVFCLTVALAYGAAAQESGTLENPSVDQIILMHPAVLQQRAAICQARSRFDLALARQVPQFSLSVSGSRVISGTIEKSNTLLRRFNRNGGEATDLTLRISQTLYDAGATASDKEIATNDRDAAGLGVSIEVETIAADILTAAIELRQQQQLAEEFARLRDDLSVIIERIEERVNLGVGRVSELREGKLIEIEAEIREAQALRRIDILKKEAVARFDLTAEQIMPFLDRFLANRPEQITPVPSEEVKPVRQLEINLQSFDHEFTKLVAERRPSLGFFVDTTLFDVENYDAEYEIVGRVEVQIPLHDGGSNRARRAENEWRKQGLNSERNNLIRNHVSQTQRAISDLDEGRQNLIESRERLTQIEERYKSVLALEGQTQTLPLLLAQLIEQASTVRAEIISHDNFVESSLLRGAFFSDKIGEILDLGEGVPTC